MKRVDVLVVGSGAGGAVTAATLARAGVEVLVVEEGPDVPAGSVQPFSQVQMRAQYRNGGAAAALGRTPIAYAEGRCVGGSTEVNSGLYHRPKAELLQRWSKQWNIEDLTASRLDPICAAIEENLHVSRFPGPLPPASEFLLEGAAALGWEAREIPRWFRFDSGSSGRRQSMSLTYLEQARRWGAEVRPDSWVRRLLIHSGRAYGAQIVDMVSGQVHTVGFETVVVCAGAIESAALLLRSGINRNVGRTLSVHPSLKAVARTAAPINDPSDVPVVQVREFSPHMSMGGSATTLPLLGLALLRTTYDLRRLSEDLPFLPIYYAAIQSRGRGRVRVLPGQRDPLVTYRLAGEDMLRLRSALGRLLLLLLAAGSTEVVPSMQGGRPIRRAADIPDAVRGLTRKSADLMTVHMCSSVPMGEDPRQAAVDSFGRSHQVSGVMVNDSSVLCEAPGINPQGTVMAIAVRNAEQFLRDRGQEPAERGFRS